MFAGTKGVHGKVRAGAIILLKSQSSERDAVGVSAGGLELVVAVGSVDRPLQDLYGELSRAFLPFSDEKT